MPRQDGTGPRGDGPPGRGSGPCATGQGGRGRRGRGRRRGWDDAADGMSGRPPPRPTASVVREDDTQTITRHDTIAVSSRGPGLDDPVDPRFGRAAGFVIVDPETMTFTHLDNSAARDMGSGAGIQAAEAVVRSGARVVITGSVGPKATQALTAAGIRMVEHMDGRTVRDVVTRFTNTDSKSAESVSG